MSRAPAAHDPPAGAGLIGKKSKNRSRSGPRLPKIAQVEVLSAATAVWMCPECGHGSPDIRDERAHLDAHRQLRAFFQEWDEGTASGQERGRRSKRRLVLLYTAFALLLVMVSALLFSRINGDSAGARASVPTIAVPDKTVVPPAPPTTAAPARSADPAPTVVPQPRRSAPQSAAVTETVAEGFVPPVAAPEPPQSAAAPATVLPQVVAPSNPHLLQLCLVGICLTVL